jgi:hypothetical protein
VHTTTLLCAVTDVGTMQGTTMLVLVMRILYLTWLGVRHPLSPSLNVLQVVGRVSPSAARLCVKRTLETLSGDLGR